LYFAEELGCAPELLAVPGVHVVTSDNRERPVWCDFRVPFLALSRGGATVLSVSDEFAPGLTAVFGTISAGEALRRRGGPQPELFAAVRELVKGKYPVANHLLGRALYCTQDRFLPTSSTAVDMLLPEHREWEEFNEHFDGPVFVVRSGNGEVAAWAAIKLKSDHVWEIAVTTVERYRRRGLAQRVVSAATSHILEAGRTPLYVHEEENLASGRTARSLGYRSFGKVAFTSLVDPARPTSIW